MCILGHVTTWPLLHECYMFITTVTRPVRMWSFASSSKSKFNANSFGKEHHISVAFSRFVFVLFFLSTVGKRGWCIISMNSHMIWLLSIRNKTKYWISNCSQRNWMISVFIWVIRNFAYYHESWLNGTVIKQISLYLNPNEYK